jgi:hypothetical protein
MEPRNKEKTELTTRLGIMELEDRTVPSIAIDVLGLATVDLHLDLALAVTTPVGANVNLDLTL